MVHRQYMGDIGISLEISTGRPPFQEIRLGNECATVTGGGRRTPATINGSNCEVIGGVRCLVTIIPHSLKPTLNFNISRLRILHGYLRPICERHHYGELEVCRSALKCAGGQHPHTFTQPLSFLPDTDFPINTRSAHVPTPTWSDPTRGGSLSPAINKSARSSSNIPPSPSSSYSQSSAYAGTLKEWRTR